MEMKTWFLVSLIYKTVWKAGLILQESEVYNAGNQSLVFQHRGPYPFFLVTTACTDAMQIKTSHHVAAAPMLLTRRRHNSLYNTKNAKIYISEAKSNSSHKKLLYFNSTKFLRALNMRQTKKML